MTIRYAPGDWFGVVRADGIAVFAPDVPPRLVESLWQRLERGGLPAVIDVLTGAFGTAVTSLPAFAVVTAEGDTWRVAVRGAVEMVVEGDAGAELIAGTGVTTWVERVIPMQARLRIVTPSNAGEELLPLVSGIVRASVVEVSRPGAPTTGAMATVEAGAPARIPASAPSPVAQPAPDVAPARSDAGLAEPDPHVTQHPHPTATAAWTAHVPSVIGASAVPAAPVLPPVPAPPPVPPPPPAASFASDAELETVISVHALVPGESWSETAATAVPAFEEFDEATLISDPAYDGEHGDHDGHTVSVSALRTARAAAPSAFGRATLSTGRTVTLDRLVVIGRRPRATRASTGHLPELIAVESPEQDISRSHLEIRQEGESVLVTDLNTTNGTTLLRPGAEPMRLHPDEPTLVLSGDVVDLGDGVTVTFEGLA